MRTILLTIQNEQTGMPICGQATIVDKVVVAFKPIHPLAYAMVKALETFQTSSCSIVLCNDDEL